MSGVKANQETMAINIMVAGLALTNCFTVYDWFLKQLPKMLGQEPLRICWPFLPSCLDWSYWPFEVWNMILWGFLIASVINALLFFNSKTRSFAFLLMGLLLIVKGFIYFQDFRLRHNPHYMLLFVQLVFLFSKNKVKNSLMVIFAIYFFSGVLKIDKNWLSGASYWRLHQVLPDTLLVISAWYVLLLELVLTFLLFAKRRWVWIAVWIQYFVFHLVSWYEVGFLYPSVMFVLLGFFTVTRSFCLDYQWGVRHQFFPLQKNVFFMELFVFVLCFAAIQIYFAR